MGLVDLRDLLFWGFVFRVLRVVFVDVFLLFGYDLVYVSFLGILVWCGVGII